LSILTALYDESNDNDKTIRFWCTDETRIGLRTITRHRITTKGIKLVTSVQCYYQAYHLYGMVEPLTGESFFLEFSNVDTVCFQVFLEEFLKQHSNNIHVIPLKFREKLFKQGGNKNGSLSSWKNKNGTNPTGNPFEK